MFKKVLYLTYDGITDPLGQSQILPYIIGLTSKGYNFHIISFEKKERYITLKDRVNDICNKHNIVWHPILFHSSPPILSKIYDRWLFKASAFKLQKREKFDLIHCRGYISSEVGLALKRKFNVPFLFDMRGLWADEKKDAGHWDTSKVHFKKIYQHYKNLERVFIRDSAHIISLTHNGKIELSRLYNDDLLNRKTSIEEKCSVIPCCADLQLFNYDGIDSLSKSELRKKLNIPENSQVITYSGSLGTWYMINEMIDFFSVYKDTYPNAIFLILTKDEDVLKNALKSRPELTNSIISTFVHKHELPLYLSLSDASVFFIRNTYSKISSSPTKHAELMGLGVPVFCNDIGDTGYFLQKYNLGVLVNLNGSKDEYSRSIKQFNENNFDQKNIRQCALDNFDVDKGVELYEIVYNKILS